MKLIYASLLAMLIAVPAYASDVRSEIDKQNAAFDQAYASHDFKKLGEMYDQNAIVYAQGSDVIKGRAGIQKLWQSYEKDFTDAHFETVEVLPAGQYAIQFGKYDAKYAGKPDQGRYITVWKKEDGTWKIVRDSWYSNQPQ